MTKLSYAIMINVFYFKYPFTFKMKKEISLAKGGASSEPTVTLTFTIKKNRFEENILQLI